MNNWKIKNIPLDSTSAGVFPNLVNEVLKISMPIPNEYLNTFGYRVAGPSLGIIGHHSEGTEMEQTQAMVEILAEYLVHCLKCPDFNDIKSVLSNYKGKRRMGNIVPAPASTLSAIKKTIEIMDDEFQNMCAFAKDRKFDK